MVEQQQSDAPVLELVGDDEGHLADEAWSLGITEFTAETQADNRSMMGVFLASGFPVTSKLEDEVITARFPIQPTDQSRASRASRADRIQSAGRRRADRP
jgi:hypothetical protein